MAIEVPRKTVLAGAGIGLAAAAVAACSSGSESEPAASSASSAPEASEAAPGAAEAGAITTTAEVPVGSGVIVDEIVVTQPVAGDYKGFSAVCTHTGCLLNEIADSTINCPCHGSKFSLDGAVVNGPASRPLDTVAVRVQGNSIVKG